MGIFGKKGVEHWIKKGKICNWNKKFEKAIECFDKALEIDPKNEIAWNNMGFAYDNLGDFKKGIECFDKRLEINSNNVNSWNNKAYALTQLEKYEEALECFDKALEIHPYSIDALVNKSKLHVNLGEYQKALDGYNQLLTIIPDYLQVIELKAQALEKLGKLEEAKYWNEMVTKEGKVGEAVKLCDEGTKFAKKRKYRRAKECFDKALELHAGMKFYPTQAAIWGQKGMCHNILGEYREAIKASDKALEIAPNYPEALHVKGGALGNMHNYEDALRCCERVVDIDVGPSSNKAWGDLRFLAKKLWGEDEAKRYISEAEKLWLSKFG